MKKHPKPPVTDRLATQKNAKEAVDYDLTDA